VPPTLAVVVKEQGSYATTLEAIAFCVLSSATHVQFLKLYLTNSYYFVVTGLSWYLCTK